MGKLGKVKKRRLISYVVLLIYSVFYLVAQALFPEFLIVGMSGFVIIGIWVLVELVQEILAAKRNAKKCNMTG